MPKQKLSDIVLVNTPESTSILRFPRPEGFQSRTGEDTCGQHLEAHDRQKKDIDAFLKRMNMVVEKDPARGF